MNVEIGYKVVRIDRKTNKLISLFESIPKNMMVTYTRNKISRPRISGARLFAYKTLEAAKCIGEDFIIYKAQLFNPISCNLLLTVVPIDDLFSFFNGNRIAESGIHNDIVHCSAIRLLEQV